MAIFKSLKKALASPHEVTTLKIKVTSKDLPSELSQFHNLSALYITSDTLSDLNIDFDAFNNLETIYITSPALENIPEKFLKLPHLIHLNLAGCHIKKFELTSQTSINLKSLSLNKNKLDSLPINLEQIESLETLNLADNNLSQFKIELMNLIHLKRLNIDRNNLIELPIDLIKKFKSLKMISLDGNKFSPEAQEKISQELGYFFGEL